MVDHRSQWMSRRGASRLGWLVQLLNLGGLIYLAFLAGEEALCLVPLPGCNAE